MRECARVRALIGEGDGKVGGGSEEGGKVVGRKDCRWKMKVRKMREREARNEKAFMLCTKGVRGK